MPKLEQWSITKTVRDPYTPPEMAVSILQGAIYGSEDFEDGTHIHSSTLMRVDLESMTAQTRNTLYELGEADQEWGKWCEEQGYTLEDFVEPINTNRG